MKSNHRNTLPIATTIVAALLIVMPLMLIVRSVHAGGQPLEGCIDLEDRPVPTQYNKYLPTFASVSTDSENSVEYYVINVNPSYYYLSQETQQWLYLRQCAHINLKHRSIRDEILEDNLREEREADCWALGFMLTERQIRFVERDIRTIERDLEQLDARQWREIFGGSRRRIYLFECLKDILNKK